MTSRERLVAAARGGEVDRRPVIGLVDEDGGDAEICVGDPEVIRSFQEGGQVVLVCVDSPYARLTPEVRARLRDADPEAAKSLDAAVAACRSEIEAGLAGGAEGIWYQLYGARAERSTPMEYGGIYLERDRELLDEIRDATINVLFLAGKDDLYLDFVSDLPAHVIAWDVASTGFTSAQVRALRNGAQASSDPDSEIELRIFPSTFAALVDRV